MGGVFYGWWLVVITGSVMVISTTPMFHAMGLWFVALEHTFGWSRTQLSLAFAFTRVEGGILGPVEGYLTDRLGTKRLVMIGMTIMGIGWLLFSLVQDTKDVPVLRDMPFHVLPAFMQPLIPPLTFYAVYMLIALGQGLGSWLPLMAMLNNWFNRRRAMAMGLSNSTSRVGTLLMIPAIAWAIDPRLREARVAFDRRNHRYRDLSYQPATVYAHSQQAGRLRTTARRRQARGDRRRVFRREVRGDGVEACPGAG